jgi:hypothetical protein
MHHIRFILGGRAGGSVSNSLPRPRALPWRACAVPTPWRTVIPRPWLKVFSAQRLLLPRRWRRGLLRPAHALLQLATPRAR